MTPKEKAKELQAELIKILPEVIHDDSGQYPSDEALEFIEKFDCAKYGCLSLTEFIEQVWWASDWGYNLKGKRKKKLQLSTGGWSGNEDIIRALKNNFVFWSMCWVETKRGGHYTFEIKNISELFESLVNCGKENCE